METATATDGIFTIWTQSSVGPGISDRCVVRRANLTVATKADRASCRMRRERLHDRAKRAKRERERERKGPHRGAEELH